MRETCRSAPPDSRRSSFCTWASSRLERFGLFIIARTPQGGLPGRCFVVDTKLLWDEVKLWKTKSLGPRVLGVCLRSFCFTLSAVFPKFRAGSFCNSNVRVRELANAGCLKTGCSQNPQKHPRPSLVIRASLHGRHATKIENAMIASLTAQACKELTDPKLNNNMEAATIALSF